VCRRQRVRLLGVAFFLDGGGACYDAETCPLTALGNPGEASQVESIGTIAVDVAFGGMWYAS
jgi:hypothetical protein